MRKHFVPIALIAGLSGALLNPCLAQSAPAPTPAPAPHIPPPISIPDTPGPTHFQMRHQSHASLFMQQVDRCWKRPGTRTVVRLAVHLNIYGQLVEPPRSVDQFNSDNPQIRDAIVAATNAVYACAPYKLPESRYREWAMLNLVFDPR